MINFVTINETKDRAIFWMYTDKICLNWSILQVLKLCDSLGRHTHKHTHSAGEQWYYSDWVHRFLMALIDFVDWENMIYPYSQ